MELPVTPNNFRKFAGQFPTGVAVITLCDGNKKLYGATLNSITALSLRPPLYLVCLANDSNTLAALSESQYFCIHYLSNHQKYISELFSSKLSDKFSLIPYEYSELGCPVIPGAIATSECKVTGMYPGGDHTIVVAEIKNLNVEEKDPLMYFRGKYASLKSLQPAPI